MIIHLQIIGIVFLGLAVMHIGFPSYFHWKTDLHSMSLINRQMMQVHALFIAITVLMMGLLCLIYHEELLTSPLGKIISLGFGLFWLFRLLIQLFGYSPKLWLGKPFESMVHILLIFFFTYACYTFLYVALA